MRKLLVLSPGSIAIVTVIVALLWSGICMAQERQTLPSNPQPNTRFVTGVKLTNVGWGLFGGGLAMTTSAIAMGLARPVKDEVLPYHHAMNALFWTGSTLVVSGIPVLIVGYVKQQHAADTYSNLICQPSYISLNVSNNGLGLSYNF